MPQRQLTTRETVVTNLHQVEHHFSDNVCQMPYSDRAHFWHSTSLALQMLENDETAMHGVLADVETERKHQDEMWGGPEHDDAHDIYMWAVFIIDKIAEFGKSSGSIGNEPSFEKTRKHLIQIAALAVAAVEAMDRVSARVGG